MDMLQLPRDLPQHLVDTAFISGNGEAAWTPLLAAEVARWLGNHGFGVLGTELWVIKPDGKICTLPFGRSGLPEVHGNTTERQENEPWISFAHRTGIQTASYLTSFNAADVLEKGDLRFQIVWATEEEYGQLQSDR